MRWGFAASPPQDPALIPISLSFCSLGRTKGLFKHRGSPVVEEAEPAPGPAGVRPAAPALTKYGGLPRHSAARAEVERGSVTARTPSGVAAPEVLVLSKSGGVERFGRGGSGSGKRGRGGPYGEGERLGGIWGGGLGGEGGGEEGGWLGSGFGPSGRRGGKEAVGGGEVGEGWVRGFCGVWSGEGENPGVLGGCWDGGGGEGAGDCCLRAEGGCWGEGGQAG